MANTGTSRGHVRVKICALCGIFSVFSVLLTTGNSDDLEIRVPGRPRSLKVTPLKVTSVWVAFDNLSLKKMMMMTMMMMMMMTSEFFMCHFLLDQLYPMPYLVPFMRYSLRHVQISL